MLRDEIRANDLPEGVYRSTPREVHVIRNVTKVLGDVMPGLRVAVRDVQLSIPLVEPEFTLTQVTPTTFNAIGVLNLA